MAHNLGGASVQQLYQLEKQVTDGLVLIKENKERELAYETDVLQGEVIALQHQILLSSFLLNVCLIFNNLKCMMQMENLKRFVPLTRQPGQLGFLEYTHAVVPSSGAAHSKHDRVRPDTICYYGSDNTDSETTLQFSYAKLEVGQNW
ncbi:hypothetical protein Hanom_Chr02g00119501 [Helianthus anomalus]